MIYDIRMNLVDMTTNSDKKNIFSRYKIFKLYRKVL